jgi:hypothetical protein
MYQLACVDRALARVYYYKRRDFFLIDVTGAEASYGCNKDTT